MQIDILEISKRLPEDFSDESNSDSKNILFNYKYLRSPQNKVYEQKIKSSAHLTELEVKFMKDHSSIINETIDLFKHIIHFHKDITNFLNDVNGGKYAQTSFDAIAQDDRRLVFLNFHKINQSII